MRIVLRHIWRDWWWIVGAYRTRPKLEMSHESPSLQYVPSQYMTADDAAGLYIDDAAGLYIDDA